MNPTSITWADFTWNPVTGCTKGCDYCWYNYAGAALENARIKE